MKGVTRSERNIANRLIEEFMLSANECVASYLENKRVASLYRIHEKPDPKRVYDFETIAAKFGYSLGVGPLPVKRVTMRAERRDRHGTGRRPQVIEIPEEVHITPRMYQKLTQKIAGKPEERILSYLMLRSLEAGALLREERRPLRAGGAGVHALHFAHPALSRPDRASHSEGRAARFAGAQGSWCAVGVGQAGAQRVAVSVVEARARAPRGRSQAARQSTASHVERSYS